MFIKKTGKWKTEPKKEVVTPIEELKSMLYEIEKVEESGKKEENKAYYIAKRVLPHLSKIVTHYKEFLNELPEEYRNSFYSLHSSLLGKHGHYYPRRLMDDTEKLKKSIYSILKKKRYL